MTLLTYLHGDLYTPFIMLVVLAIWGLLLFLLIAFVRFLVTLSRESNREDD